MEQLDAQFTLSYSGSTSEEHAIDLYDVSQALMGFHRSLALTTHLVLNNEIITQAPSLKGARIYAFPTSEGSWKVTAGIVFTAIYHVGTAPEGTPLGHLVSSVYDYVVSESLGFHIDYDKSLGQLYEENKAKNVILPQFKKHQIESLMEKCSMPLKEIHRPIYKTKTATMARITTQKDKKEIPLKAIFSSESYSFLTEEYEEKDCEIIKGLISSYNTNTYTGRIYVKSEGRPISFELEFKIRSSKILIRLIIQSLRNNALKNFNKDFDKDKGIIYCKVHKRRTKTGFLKRYEILDISSEDSFP